MRTILATMLLLAPLTAGAAEKNYKITYIQGVTGNPFYMSVSCGATEAAKRLGVTFDSQGPQQYTPALQMRVLDAVIAGQPDGIMFTADDPVALTATLIEAKQRGIKIMSIDGDLKEAIAKFPDIEFLGVQFSNNQTAKAASIITSTIAANPDLVGVFTITTNNTEGAATGIREAQREGKIKIVGFDTSDPIVEAIRSGIVAADIVQYPYRVGQLGLENMVAALDGKPIDREITTPFVVATPQNIDTPEVQKYIYRTNCR